MESESKMGQKGLRLECENDYHTSTRGWENDGADEKATGMDVADDA
jgi:hypothetical protein